jgi:hypothetical protein
MVGDVAVVSGGYRFDAILLTTLPSGDGGAGARL